MIRQLLWGVSDLSTPRDVILDGKYGVTHADICVSSWCVQLCNRDVRVRGRTFEGGEVCKDK